MRLAFLYFFLRSNMPLNALENAYFLRLTEFLEELGLASVGFSGVATLAAKRHAQSLLAELGLSPTAIARVASRQEKRTRPGPS